jgi:hypothetical protein
MTRFSFVVLSQFRGEDRPGEPRQNSRPVDQVDQAPTVTTHGAVAVTPP